MQRNAKLSQLPDGNQRRNNVLPDAVVNQNLPHGFRRQGLRLGLVQVQHLLDGICEKEVRISVESIKAEISLNTY